MTAATFCYTRLEGAHRSWQPLFEYLRTEALSPLAEAGVGRWGAWFGLFGVGSNELVLMTTAEPGIDHKRVLNTRLATAPGEIAEQYLLVPTARPVHTQPLTRHGVYVFRFFDVRNSDVDEIVALSHEAWTTFEATDAYRAEPQGLFCERDRRGPDGIVLLCTWYDGLESWQASRAPPPAAAENFRRRHLLTRRTVAYATRLILE